MTIRKKFSILAIVFCMIGVGIFSLAYIRTLHQRDVSLEVLKTELISSIEVELEIATNVIATEIGRQIKAVEEDQVIETIRNVVQDIRFYENQSGYFFVYTLDGINIALPPNPSKHGQDLSKLKDADGVYFVKELSRRAQNGGGFVFYSFPKPGKQGDQPKLSYSKLIPGTDYFIGTGVYIDDVDDKVANTKKQLDKAAGTTLMLLLLAMICAIIALAFSGVIVRSILNALSHATRFMTEIAEGNGDLTVKMVASEKDEIGLLGLRFNEFIEKLKTIVINLRSEVNHVDISSNEMKSTSESLSATAENLGHRADKSSVATQSLTQNIDELSNTSESVANDVSNVAASIEEMNATIAEVAKNCAKESEVTNRANQRSIQMKASVSELKEASEQINQVIDIISSIADQTNLLALNATIEAASAGEAGKGFAVVANEVKELAKQSAEATDRIRKQVETIQHSSGHAITGMEDIAEIVGEIDEIANSIAAAIEEQSTATHEISSLTQRVAESVQSVSQNTEEISKSSHEVSQNVEETSDLSQQTAAGATESNATAANLADVANRLRQITDQFIVD